MFYYEENCATEEHGESDIEYDDELSEEDIGGDNKSYEHGKIRYKDLDINESAPEYAPYVKFSTG